MTQETQTATTEAISVDDALPRVDVVVATRNRPELLRVALDGDLEPDLRRRDRLHVVFDQCDPDESVARTSPTRTVRVIDQRAHPGVGGRPQLRHR